MHDLGITRGGPLALLVNLLLEHSTHVSSGAKTPASTSHDDDTHVTALAEGSIRLGEFIPHQCRIGVELLRAIEGEGRNVILHFDQNLFVVHEASSRGWVAATYRMQRTGERRCPLPGACVHSRM